MYKFTLFCVYKIGCYLVIDKSSNEIVMLIVYIGLLQLLFFHIKKQWIEFLACHESEIEFG